MKFQANIHGAKIKGGGDSFEKKPADSFKFGDPEAYKNMSMEERKRLTEKMMGQHRSHQKLNMPAGKARNG